MPNRVIRSGFLDSEKINSLKYDEQLFFVRLMLVADDFGCFDARETMIKSACYPVTDIRLTDVSKWLSAVCNAGLVSIYESCGKKFLLINNFEQRLRQKRRKYPEPIELQNMSDTCQSIDGHLHATMPESESESESESEKKTPISPKRDCEFFNSFWQLYPKKVGKGAVEKAWSKIKQPEYTLEQIKTALAWQMQSEQWTKESGQYIPMPSTYLNQRRWEDEKIVTAQTIKTGPKELTSADCENLYKDN